MVSSEQLDDVHGESAEVLVESLVWHPSRAAEPFVLYLPSYFADAYGEPGV